MEIRKPRIPVEQTGQRPEGKVTKTAFAREVRDALRPRVDKTAEGDVIVTMWSQPVEIAKGKIVRSTYQTPMIPGVVPPVPSGDKQ